MLKQILLISFLINIFLFNFSNACDEDLNTEESFTELTLSLEDLKFLSENKNERESIKHYEELNIDLFPYEFIVENLSDYANIDLSNIGKNCSNIKSLSLNDFHLFG